MKIEWKPVIGYEGKYEVSNNGDVKSLLNRYYKTKGILLLTPSVSNGGYKQVTLSNPRKKLLVHRLVGEAFLHNPDSKPQINHIDNNRQNNSVENLEWSTQSENLIHAQRQGRLVEAHKKAASECAKSKRKKSKLKAKSLVGNKINSWTVLEYVGAKKFNYASVIYKDMLLCECDCGFKKEIDLSYLINVATKCSNCSFKERRKVKI